MKLAAACPHCKKAVAVLVTVEGPEVLPAVRAIKDRMDQRVRAHQNGQSCVQATPDHRCPECGTATRLVYGTKKATGQGYQGQKCVKRSCELALSDRFIPGTFRWVGQQAVAAAPAPA